MNSSMGSKSLVGMSTTNIHLPQFNYKMRTLHAGTSELIPKKNPPKFQTLHSYFAFFIKMLCNQIAIPSTLESTS